MRFRITDRLSGTFCIFGQDHQPADERPGLLTKGTFAPGYPQIVGRSDCLIGPVVGVVPDKHLPRTEGRRIPRGSSRPDSSRLITCPMARHHARSVPPVENVDRCVAVAIVPVPARSADEDSLAFAAPSVHGPAGRAGLGSVRRVELHEPRRLAGRYGLDPVPTDVQDCAVQSVHPGNVPARFIDRASCRSRHVLSRVYSGTFARVGVAAIDLDSACGPPGRPKGLHDLTGPMCLVEQSFAIPSSGICAQAL